MGLLHDFLAIRRLSNKKAKEDKRLIALVGSRQVFNLIFFVVYFFVIVFMYPRVNYLILIINK